MNHYLKTERQSMRWKQPYCEFKKYISAIYINKPSARSISTEMGKILTSFFQKLFTHGFLRLDLARLHGDGDLLLILSKENRL